jgi:hypothetical protein
MDDEMMGDDELRDYRITSISNDLEYLADRQRGAPAQPNGMAWSAYYMADRDPTLVADLLDRIGRVRDGKPWASLLLPDDDDDVWRSLDQPERDR